ncbi:MAG: hypothetical protein HRU38_04250 [Saccharospirillaceae bacterium]|nr:hypothetical protein [Pseudomonadales bacterium]NRB77871.1 hypothetical protein [Saccharospirillaceae bacterium]
MIINNNLMGYKNMATIKKKCKRCSQIRGYGWVTLACMLIMYVSMKL